METKVLLVDDEEKVLNGLKRHFRRRFDIDTATSAEDGLAKLKSAPYAVVISDQKMPGMSGITFLKQALEDYPQTVRIMLTGGTDGQTPVDSVNECQVFRYIKKPCSPDELSQAIEDGLNHHRMIIAERELLHKTLAGSVKLLVDFLALSDSRNFKQNSLLRGMAKRLTGVVEQASAWELDMAIMLSPIGEVALPPEVRAKHERGEVLSQIEQKLIAATPKVARDLLLNIPRMRKIAEAVYYQNKAYDGSGYPFDPIKGDGIPLTSRVLYLLQRLVEVGGGRAPLPQDFDTLEKSAHLFDPRLLKLARGVFLEKDQSTDGELINLNVGICELMCGDVLLQDLRTESGSLALAAHNEITDATRHKVMNFHKLHRLAEPVRIQRQRSPDRPK